MQQKKYTIIANWKMYFSHKQALSYLENNKTALQQLATKSNIIICPSFESLATCKHVCTNLPIVIGAQDCSAHDLGPFTGQVCAQSLKELGCNYCLIGHSETYEHWNNDKETILSKLSLAIRHAIEPILCFGENQEEHEKQKTEQSITQQITDFCTTLKKYAIQKALFAYEPKWAIGSGRVPALHDLEKNLSLVKKITHEYAIDARLLYGGSISSQNIVALKSIALLDGFLLGKVSTDFQELKKVVSLLYE